MRFSTTLGIVVALSCLAETNINAAIVITADVNTALDGTQDETSVVSGDLFDVALFMELTDSSQVSSYTLSARFDSTRFEFVSGEAPLPDGFEFGDASVEFDPLDSIPGFAEIDLIDATSFGSGRRQGDGRGDRFQIASLTLRASGSASTGGPTDFLPGLFLAENPQNAIADNAGLVTSGVSFFGASVNITAVPEPSSVMVLCFAFGAASRVRRKRRS